MRNAHQLALALGILDVDAMMEQISAVQFIRWIAFKQLEPFGEERMDFRFANLMAQQANLHSKRSKYTAKDFMPDFEAELEKAEEKAKTPEHERLANKIKSVFARFKR